jgi:type II secretory ATPase GspE/PulE/Tfp pilus assembly ATPase PilB-like protein
MVITFLVAHDAPQDLEQTLRFVVDSDVELIKAERRSVADEIFRQYRGSVASILSSQRELLQSSESRLRDHEIDRVERILMQGDSRAAKFIRTLVDYAIANDASDLHLTPTREGVKANIRVNGQLLSHEDVLCPLWTFEKIVQILKLLITADTTVKFNPQDGSFGYRAAQKDIAVRVSLIPTVHGERAVLRFLGSKPVSSLIDLGYSLKAFNFLKNSLNSEDGLIIFAGATGSGKTTAMYGAIAELRKYNLNISTIENPVEQVVSGISQTQINEAQGLTYVAALKAIMRQDPDVILVGETRDAESAEGVTQAALTGHLVITTVHGRTVFDAAKRLMSLAPEPNLVPDIMRILVHQRLAPRLCPDCKVPDLNATRMAIRHPVLNLRRIFVPGGCSRCKFTGYVGQIPVPEILLITPQIADRMKNNLAFSMLSLGELLDPSNYLSYEESLLCLLADEEVPYPEDL